MLWKPIFSSANEVNLYYNTQGSHKICICSLRCANCTLASSCSVSLTVDSKKIKNAKCELDFLPWGHGQNGHGLKTSHCDLFVHHIPCRAKIEIFSFLAGARWRSKCPAPRCRSKIRMKYLRSDFMCTLYTFSSRYFFTLHIVAHDFPFVFRCYSNGRWLNHITFLINQAAFLLHFCQRFMVTCKKPVATEIKRTICPFDSDIRVAADSAMTSRLATENLLLVKTTFFILISTDYFSSGGWWAKGTSRRNAPPRARYTLKPTNCRF